MSRYSAVVLVVSVTLISSLSPASNQTASDPRAVAFAAQSIGTLTGGAVLNDVTLTGTATWVVGGESQTGNATFMALGSAESRFDIGLPSGTRTEIRDASAGVVQGKWVAPDGSSGVFSSQNCYTDAVWFMPVLGSLAGGPNVVLSYIGQEMWNGSSVQHIQSFLYLPSAPPTGGPSPGELSMMDFYLDSTTLLPVSVTFNMHPDDSVSNNVLVEVDFSNYQVINGMSVPMHIQKSMQGTLTLDFTVSSAAFNTGLLISNFTIN